ncbi:MAG: ATP-binding protein [Gemmatimonadetes bacterium]|jgi:predicted HTH transcriptional regulator|nr:ATP-binding protein [Gemmatimonadota bacterium]
MLDKRRSWKEDFARFFESPSREALRDLIRDHAGELDEYDFKLAWPAFSKVARHIIAMANSGGGAIVFGVQEKDDGSFEPKGLESMVDKADVQRGLSSFLPGQIGYEVVNFTYSASEYSALVGKTFQVLIVDDLPQYLPFTSKGAGDGIREDTIYIRRGTSSERANYEELQQILNRRIETGYSSRNELKLEQHLAELKALYQQVPRYRSIIDQLAVMGALYEPNPRFPKEDLPDFVLKLIEAKKKIIESIVLRR